MINENTVFELLDSTGASEHFWKVIWVSPDSEYVIVMDVTNKSKMSFPFQHATSEIYDEVESGRMRKSDCIEDVRITSPSIEYLNKYKVSRDAKWDIIKNLVTYEPEIYDPHHRWKMIVEICESTEKSYKEIYKYLKKYWFYGKSINGLLPDYFDCGHPKEEKPDKLKPGPKTEDGHVYVITDKDKKNFMKAIEKFHKKEKKNIKDTHEAMLERDYPTGSYRAHGVVVNSTDKSKAPSLRQFRYWYNKECPIKFRYGAKYGTRKAEIDVRSLEGNTLEMVEGVGALYEIDSTPADLLLVSSHRTTEYGRPNVYIVLDIYSRLISGFYVTLLPPSYTEAMMALENASTDKVEFCLRYDIEITEDEWPAQNLPAYIASDRGELKGKRAENLVNLNVELANAPSYRGDLKPYVEQQFRLLNAAIRKHFPGAIHKQNKERGDQDPARKAVVTIKAFTKFLIHYIRTYNQTVITDNFLVTPEMAEDNVNLTPIDIWNWSKAKKLLHEKPRDVIQYNLLPKEKGTVTRFGIEFKNIMYSSNDALKEGWFESERFEGSKHVEVSFDPRNCSSILLRRKKGDIIPCFLTDKFKEFDGMHFDDIKDIMNFKKEKLKETDKNTKHKKGEFNAIARKLAEEEKQKTAEATKGMSHYAKQQNKRAVRRVDSRDLGSRNAWTGNENLHNDSEPKSSETAVIVTFPKDSRSRQSIEDISHKTEVTESTSFLKSMSQERKKMRENME